MPCSGGQCVNIKVKRADAGFAVKDLEGCNPRIAAQLKPQANKRPVRVKWSSHDVEAKVSARVRLAQIFTAAIGEECQALWGRTIVTSSRVNPTDKSATRFLAGCGECLQMLKVGSERHQSRTSKPRTRLRSISVCCVCSEAVAAASAAREVDVWALSQRRHH
jgi:hypothetical protein